MGPDLLVMVEDTRTMASIPVALNSTFIALIPKTSHPETYEYVRQISLCNLVYKVVAKIISNRIKSVLSKSILAEQFGFLEKCQILDAIGLAQETFHSIKTRNKKALVLQMDLSQAYGKVNWGFLRLAFIQIDIPWHAMKWIIACVSLVNYSVLFNGSSSKFFSASRGLGKGFPLSPLLFLVVIEGLSRLLIKAIIDNQITGFNISKNISVTHDRLVDDVMLFGKACIIEWAIFKEILDLFSKSTSMVISDKKSTFPEHDLDDQLRGELSVVFPFNFKTLVAGTMYLGYFIKPNAYKSLEWTWLLK